jgi:hypothetical protein
VFRRSPLPLRGIMLRGLWACIFSGRRILFFGQPLCELCFGIGQNVYGEQKDGIFLDDDFYFCTAIV